MCAARSKLNPLPRDILAEVTLRVGLGDRGFDNVDHVAILAANVNVTALGAHGASGDHHAFDELMRIHFHQRTVFTCAGLAFVAIGDDVFRLAARFFGDETPLHAGREACAAASAQIRFLHFVDDLVGRHLLQRFFERLIAVVLEVDVDFIGIGNSETAANHDNLGGMSLVNGARNYGYRLRALALLELLEDRVDFRRVEILVIVVIDLNRRRAGAGADTFDFFERKGSVGRDLLVANSQALLNVLEKFVAAAQHAGNIRADLNVVAAFGLAAEHRVIRESLGDFDQIQADALGDFFEHFVAQKSELILRVQHHGNQRRALDGVASE